jgi:sister-chromatid-cohesion protein PDS5
VECFKTLFAEFLKRLTDRVVEIRISVVEYSKRCLISNPSRAEAPEIISKELSPCSCLFDLTDQ